MASIDPRRVVGGQMHALDKHVTHASECRRLFGSNWVSIIVNRTVIQCYDRLMMGNTRSSTFIFVTFNILGT